MFGFYLGNHPVSNYKANYKNIMPLSEVNNNLNKKVECLVLIEKTKVIDTKKGDKMMFVTGSDEYGKVDFTFFPQAYKDYPVKNGDVVKIDGHVERRYDVYQIIVEKVDKLS